MPFEIEHKYLVNLDNWKGSEAKSSVQMTQAYMKTDGNKTIRVRTTSDKAFLTIKGKTTGTKRSEFEYEIPLDEAHKLIEEFCEEKVEKTRHYIEYKGKTWEVDEFAGANKGLWIAEIELESEDESYELPEWVGKDVTLERKYTNAALAENPFSRW